MHSFTLAKKHVSELVWCKTWRHELLINNRTKLLIIHKLPDMSFTCSSKSVTSVCCSFNVPPCDNSWKTEKVTNDENGDNLHPLNKIFCLSYNSLRIRKETWPEHAFPLGYQREKWGSMWCMAVYIKRSNDSRHFWKVQVYILITGRNWKKTKHCCFEKNKRTIGWNQRMLLQQRQEALEQRAHTLSGML